MIGGTPQAYSYYAFISYSHKDKAAARRLQKALEHSRIPAALHRTNRAISKKISPIFRDDTDLVNHSSLYNDLRGELFGSRFLILLCSPAAARSAWVNEEVRTFIALGRADRIIPVIVSGVPHSGDPETECLPPALLAMDSRTEPLAISLREHGKRGVYRRVLASLLGVRLNEIADRDKKLRRRRTALRAAACLLLAMIASFVLWYNLPVKTYYRDYTYRWDIPAGLERVSAAERKERCYTYCFTKKRGRVISVERLNAAGALTDADIADLWTEPARILYYYEDTGLFGKKTLRSRDYYNSAGKKLYSMRFTAADGTDTRAVDLASPDKNSSAFGAAVFATTPFLDAANPDADDPASMRTPISRYLQTYDEQGYTATRRFMRDSWNRPAANGDGVYGLKFEYTAEGRVQAVLFLDAAGEISDCGGISVGERYRYSDTGELTESVRLKAYAGADDYTPVDGSVLYVYQRRMYDETGRIRELRFLDGEKQPMASAENLGAAALKIKYNAQGFPAETAFLDEYGDKADNYDGYAVIKRQYDKKGRVTEERYLNEDGDPVCCVTDGTAAVTYAYDAEGNLTELRFYDENGVPAVSRTLGGSRVKYEYQNGHVSSVEFRDADGDLCETGAGYAVKRYRYNDEGQRTETAFYNAQNAPVAAANGAAKIKYAYKEGGLSIIAYCDADGGPVLNVYGYSECRFERKDGLVSVCAYYGAQGEPAAPYADCWARQETDYDEFTRPVEERYYDESGAPVNTNGGYAVKKYGWQGDLSDTFLDENGRQVTPDAETSARAAGPVEMIRVEGFAEGYPAAEQAGMRQYDVFTEYNDWSYADCYTDPARTEAGFSEATAAGRDGEKYVTVARRTANGGRERVRLVLPAGIAGFIYNAVYVSRGHAEKYILGP